MVVSREIYANGKNICKINGRLVTVSELKNFMKDIIDIHGQHENQSLLEENTHRKLLDNFAEKEIQTKKEEYQKIYDQYCFLRGEIQKNFGDEKERQRELDLLRYQNKEIEEAELKGNEEEELKQIREKMLNSEKIIQSLSEANHQISIEAIDAISLAVKALEKIEGIDAKYEGSYQSLKSIYYDIQELARDFSNFEEDIYFDEEERSYVETRLDLITMLKRKYGNTIEEILNYNEEIKNRIQKIENSENYINMIKKELQQTTNLLRKSGLAMYEIRKRYAKILEEKVNLELIELEMKQAKFFVSVRLEENLRQSGLDQIEFMICTNLGEDKKPLSKIASGGEMSRIMLAIKNVLANVDEIPIMVFDEIDTGISGMAAKSVGEKLKAVSKKHQVLCVTHLANIAAKGNNHYLIQKQIEENQTRTRVKKLNEEETIQEIARIASGDINKITIEHAKNLRKTA